MEIKGQMADFLCGAGIETLKLRLAEGEILQVEKCGPQSNPGEPKANAEKNEVSGVLGEWGEGKCGWSMWHAEQWQEMLLEEQLGPQCPGPSALC